MRYYATLGYTPSVLLGLRDYAAASPRVTVFHGDLNHQQSRALAKARIILEELNVRARFVETTRPWNLEECLRVLFGQYARDGRPSDLVVNASGGTEVMNAAATILCFFAGCKGQFVDRHSWKQYTVDFGLLREAFRQEGSRGEILEALAAAGGRLEVAELPERLGVTPGAVSQTLSALRQMRLVKVGPKEEGRGKVALLDPALWALQLFGDPKGRES